MATALVVAFILGFDALTYLLDRDVVTPFQLDTYRSARDAGALALLWITFVIVAPAGEEILFRGFLFRGWAASPRAVWPAIVVISALWAIIHVQYDWFGILQVFLGGLLLGWLRWGSGSTLLTFWLHALTNIWATAQTAIKVEWLS
jgi:membrane protease YdiL (CAAX protease family)